ncbi:MAG TPA: DedA family protein [Burkholderiaceae bacterium]|nr:DedA family protein [Burkholderiaceae bacterium]
MLDWITAFLDRSGYLGVALLMFAENVFPPIPSELIMPFAGFAAAQGRMNLVGVVLAGTAGSIAGGTMWYLLGRRLGVERVRRLADRWGRWLTVDRAEVDRVDAWFDRHGGKAVLIGRLVPAVRTLVSLPAGITGMGWTRFLLLSSIGTALWTAVLATAGYLLKERFESVEAVAGPVGNVVLGVAIAWYLWRVATWGRRRPSADPAAPVPNESARPAPRRER